MSMEELKTTAKLAMLDISETEKIEEGFSQMLQYFSRMMEVDVSKLEPTTHALAKGNRLRKDEVTNSEADEEFLELAPDRQDRFFKIPNVL